jgi:hypothetical protein
MNIITGHITKDTESDAQQKKYEICECGSAASD